MGWCWSVKETSSGGTQKTVSTLSEAATTAESRPVNVLRMTSCMHTSRDTIQGGRDVERVVGNGEASDALSGLHCALPGDAACS